SVTVPVTVLPAGNTTRSPTITFSFTSPVHVSPTFAVSDETCEETLTLMGVPASTFVPAFSAGAGDEEDDVGFLDDGFDVVFGVDVAGVASGFGSLYWVCGVMLPWGCSTGFDAIRLSLVVVSEAVWLFEHAARVSASRNAALATGIN